MRYFVFCFGFALLLGCSSTKKTPGNEPARDIKEIRFINEYILPNGIEFKNTVVGGLSGIDYDIKRDLYYLISDDPSTKGPTRFYTAKIFLTGKGIDSVQIVNMIPLLNPAGVPYADITKDRIHSADVEAMRYDAIRDELTWSSEGQRFIRDGKQELEDPAIVVMDREGHFKDSFALPANMHIQFL